MGFLGYPFLHLTNLPCQHLDENHYNGITDYELEFEVNDEEKGLKQFEELCQTYHLQYKGNCASKITRVLSTLKAGL